MPYRLVRRVAVKEDQLAHLDEARLRSLAAAHGVRDPDSFTREQLIARISKDTEDFLRGELLVGIAVGLVVILGLVVFSLYNTVRVGDVQDQIKANQISQCKGSLQPGGLRYIEAERIRQQEAQSRAIPASFFPGIPPRTFKRLQRQSAEQARSQIRQVLHVNCDALYATH